MKILNFGSCNIDYVYELSHIVKPGETTKAYSLTRFPGGKGLNQSIALAKSGITVYHAGCIGNDGGFLKETLMDCGVDTRYIKVNDDVCTGHAIIQLDKNGENCIIIHHGANYQIEKSYIDTVFESFASGDVLLLQNEICNLEYLIEKGYEKNMKIVLNPSPFVKSLCEIDLNKISVLILNEIEAQSLTGETEIEKIKEYIISNYNNLNVVLTLGGKGSVYLSKNQVEYCPAFPVDVVDTTAAGDTFTGYFISATTQGVTIKNSLQLASVAAGLAVSKKGASSSIPNIDETNEALLHFKERLFKNAQTTQNE